MAISVADIIDYKEFKIVPVPIGDAYIARIRRADGRHFVVGFGISDYFDTMQFADKDAAVSDAKLIADSATLQK